MGADTSFLATAKSFRKYTRSLLGAALLLPFLLQSAGIEILPFIPRLENIAYDYRLRATTPGGMDSRVVIVDLDERSLSAEGQWPWRRDKMAHLVDMLFDHYSVEMLGFDVVFAEYADRSALSTLDALAQGPLASNQEYLNELKRLRPTLEYDRLLADSLRGRQVILGYSASMQAKIGELPAPVMVLEKDLMRIPFASINGYSANLPELQRAASGGGFFDNTLVDSDGVFRRVPMVNRFGDNLYESLSLAMVRTLYGKPPLKLVVESDVDREVERGLEWLQAGAMRIPVDERGAALVPYRGKSGSFPYVSATDVLQGKADPKVLERAIVLLGTTAPGLMDLRATPVQNIYPGVEIHANLVAGILDQKIKGNPAYTQGLELVALFVIGLLLNLLLPRFSPLAGLAVVVFVLAVVMGVNLYFWSGQQLVVPFSSQWILIFVLFLFHSAYGFFVESKGKQRMGLLFGQYVPPEIVEQMSDSDEDFGISGESRNMTVFFSDIRNFTAISENLEPDELTRMMNEYLSSMTGIIQRQHGTIDKYIGDAVMAFWGAPLRDPEHPGRAVKTALEMVQTMHQVRSEFANRGWPELHIGIGINTGVMNVGNMGSEFRMSYTVLGDAVNLGSRLEGLTKQYGVEIVVSESTRNAVEGITFRELGWVRVKGKSEPVGIFEPIGFNGDLTPTQMRSLLEYEKALVAFRAQDWDSAENGFVQLAREEPGHLLYQLYLRQIAEMRADPPAPGWDAVINFQSK